MTEAYVDMSSRRLVQDGGEMKVNVWILAEVPMMQDEPERIIINDLAEEMVRTLVEEFTCREFSVEVEDETGEYSKRISIPA